MIIFVIITFLNITLPFSKTVSAQPNFKYYINPFFRTIIKYPSDWLHLDNGKAVLFISPGTNNSTIGSARILVQNPIDSSILGTDLESHIINNDFKQKEGIKFFQLPMIFHNGPQTNTAYLYTYNDSIFGKTNVMDVFVEIDDQVSHIEYQADPNSYDPNFPIFREMLHSYNIIPTSSQLSCDPIDLPCGLDPHSTLPPSEGRAFSNLINVETLGHQ